MAREPVDIELTTAPETRDDGELVLLTIGHGTHSASEFGRLLAGAGARSLVDIRIGQGSRRNPQFQRASLEEALPQHGIEYRWEGRLGGFRKLPPDSPDIALRNESFRAYAAHMRTAQFRAAVEELLEHASRLRTAIMCSESVWWRCHRRLVADAIMLLHAWDVLHIMPNGKLVRHQPTDEARLDGDELYYSGNQ
ncbi:MAG TPA: DUF488 domain-containing protein [Jatrophihabitans sp.]|nr:DUF488 domain-containing protein [Jatrophihabitans sp.]